MIGCIHSLHIIVFHLSQRLLGFLLFQIWGLSVHPLQIWLLGLCVLKANQNFINLCVTELSGFYFKPLRVATFFLLSSLVSCLVSPFDCLVSQAYIHSLACYIALCQPVRLKSGKGRPLYALNAVCLKIEFMLALVWDKMRSLWTVTHCCSSSGTLEKFISELFFELK